MSVQDHRLTVLASATRCRDRVALFASLASGKRTLDVGCTGARPGKGPTEASLERHQRIAAAASECVGIDLDKQGIEALRRLGCDAVAGDACEARLPGEFECIVAGEIVEHLPDPAAFFRNMRRHLAVGGKLVVSTCNPFSSRQLWKILRYGRPSVHPDHTHWHDPLTIMRLAQCHGFQAEALFWERGRSRFDLRLLPAAFRSYFCGSFVLMFEPSYSPDKTE